MAFPWNLWGTFAPVNQLVSNALGTSGGTRPGGQARNPDPYRQPAPAVQPRTVNNPFAMWTGMPNSTGTVPRQTSGGSRSGGSVGLLSNSGLPVVPPGRYDPVVPRSVTPSPIQPSSPPPPPPATTMSGSNGSGGGSKPASSTTGTFGTIGKVLPPASSSNTFPVTLQPLSSPFSSVDPRKASGGGSAYPPPPQMTGQVAGWGGLSSQPRVNAYGQATGASYNTSSPIRSTGTTTTAVRPAGLQTVQRSYVQPLTLPPILGSLARRA